MQIIQGKTIADSIYQNLSSAIEKLETKPMLAIVMIGDNPASLTYIEKKLAAAQKIGIRTEVFRFNPNQYSEAEAKLLELNNDKDVHGIIIQLPLKKREFTNTLINQINPAKDVDGLTALRLGKAWHQADEWGLGATPKAIINVLRFIAQQEGFEFEQFIRGKSISILNHSVLIGKPLAGYLCNFDATVSICNAFTKNIIDFTSTADIVVSATGKPKLLNHRHFKQDAIVIDAGFAKDSFENIQGDVDLDNLDHKISWLSPVPGGVGPIGVAMLMQNTYDAFQSRRD